MKPELLRALARLCEVEAFAAPEPYDHQNGHALCPEERAERIQLATRLYQESEIRMPKNSEDFLDIASEWLHDMSIDGPDEALQSLASLLEATAKEAFESGKENR